jgi:phosphoribosylformylglycinamidine synthase
VSERRHEPAVDAALAAAHGLSAREWERLLAIVGRPPTYTELGIFSAMWSEHCSYKSSRHHLTRLPTKGRKVVQGPGENAGAVDIGGGLCAVFKMESHNHPSFIEPFQGAATGVGGILRDVFTMGARPIAAMNSLRFGDPSHPRTATLVEGVVRGIGHYGNCFGVPTVGGEVAFDESYDGNILVNAFALGIARQDRLFRGKAAGVGNPVLYVGAKTGRDGIHGATMASEEFTSGEESKRPTVQVGDPFTEKLLLEACLEAMASEAVVGIQDMGAAGLTSSSVEMAGRAGNGLELWLEKVPVREPGMTPYEILLSESQERMLLVARAGREGALMAIFAKWDLDAVPIGVVTGTGRLVVSMEGEVVADLPVGPISEEAPKYGPDDERPLAAGPSAALQARWRYEAPADIGSRKEAAEALSALLGSPSLASKRWVWRQYDHMVRLATAVRPGDGEAAVMRVMALDGRGPAGMSLAMSIDCNARWCGLDPRRGAAAAVAEAARNVSCVGAEPLALTDCLNFASPERPEVMWQFSEAVDGIAEACNALGIPVVSGNVSFYNETDGRPILPTPMIGLVGVMPTRTPRVWTAPRAAGLELLLLGPPPVGPEAASPDGLAASEYLRWKRGPAGGGAGRPPAIDWVLERAMQELVRKLVRERLVVAAHDVAEGGLGLALAEMCVAGREPLGMKVSLPGAGGGRRVDVRLFGEQPSRVVVAAEVDCKDAIFRAAGTAKVPVCALGATGGDALEIVGIARVALAELCAVWEQGFERAVFAGRGSVAKPATLEP